jgi:hypothetical protein
MECAANLRFIVREIPKISILTYLFINQENTDYDSSSH